MEMKKNETVNVTNNFAKHSRARKLDLGTIAQLMENESSTGFISKDLYDALKMAEAAGLCAEDKPLPKFLQWEERELDYNAERLSKEADVTLLLRAKAGDKEATDKLVNSKMPIIYNMARQLQLESYNVTDILENDFDSYVQVVSESFLLHIIQHPVCSQGKIMYSHSNLIHRVYESLKNKTLYTTESGKDINLFLYTKKIAKSMKECDIDITNISKDQYVDFCINNKICGEHVARLAYGYEYECLTKINPQRTGLSKCYNDNCIIMENKKIMHDSTREANGYSVDRLIERIAVDTSQTPYLGEDTNYYTFNPENVIVDNSDFIDIVMKIREENPKYKRAIETLFAHVLGDASFDFKKIMAEDADDVASLKKTAEIMGYESVAEAKAAKKRARELIFKKILHDYPEVFADVTKDIGKIKAI